MHGLLSDIPLLGVLELIHQTRQSGVLEVQADVPYTLAFVGGEIVSGGILDWLGTDALYSTPMLPESGSFSFQQKQIKGQPLGQYGHVTTDWARINDEWEEICGIIGSPSRYFQGSVPLFNEKNGRSVRGAAREAEVSVFHAAQVVAQAVKNGELRPLARHEWFRLRLLPSGRASSLPGIARLLNGENTLGDVIAAGIPAADARAYLLAELRLGLRFPGSGWVLRDLVWEQKNLSLKP